MASAFHERHPWRDWNMQSVILAERSNPHLTVKRQFDYCLLSEVPGFSAVGGCEVLREYSAVYLALSDENRLAILELLADGERCLCDVAESLGISNALASHHVKRLREAGLVVTERRGAWLHCRLDTATVQAAAEALRDLATDASFAAGIACCTNGSSR